MLLSIAVLLFMVFRRSLLEPFIGVAGMFLFDAILFTLLAAWQLAAPGPWITLSYIMGVVCALIAFASARNFLRLKSESSDD